MHSDYGTMYLVQIESGNDFWCLIREMQDDSSDFFSNISIVTERYKEGKLFGLRVSETDSMYRRGARNDSLFCRTIHGDLSWYLLPCFCIRNGNESEIYWVHSRARRTEIGETIIKLFNNELI